MFKNTIGVDLGVPYTSLSPGYASQRSRSGSLPPRLVGTQPDESIGLGSDRTNGRFPPNPAVHPGRCERRVLLRERSFVSTASQRLQPRQGDENGRAYPKPRPGRGDTAGMRDHQVTRDAGVDLLHPSGDLGYRVVLVAIVHRFELAAVDRNDGPRE